MSKEIAKNGIILYASEIIKIASEVNIVMQRMLTDNISKHTTGKFNSDIHFPSRTTTTFNIDDIKYIIDARYSLKYSFQEQCIKAVVGEVYISLVKPKDNNTLLLMSCSSSASSSEALCDNNPILLMSCSSSVSPNEALCDIGNDIQAKLIEKLTKKYFVDPDKNKDKNK